MASKQDNYLRMHHPSIFKKMKKGGKVEDYAKGGKVKYYAYGGRNTDTVPAMLTPGEVVLNADQQEDLGNMMAGGGKVSEGQAKAAALFKHIGVPGFQEGIVLPTKEDVGKLKETKELYTTGDPKLKGGASMFAPSGGYSKDYFAEQIGVPTAETKIDTAYYRSPSDYSFNVTGGDTRAEFTRTMGMPRTEQYGTKKEEFLSQYGKGVQSDLHSDIAKDDFSAIESKIGAGFYGMDESGKSDYKIQQYREKKKLEEANKPKSKYDLIREKYANRGYAGGGLVDKKDALMAYYMGGKVKKKKKKRGY
jgi:hypothetical protein